MNQLRERLRRDFTRPDTEDARYAYAEAFLNAYVAAQIRTLREDFPLSQEELAALAGTKQSGISRHENVNHASWKVETLRKLARALGVRLVIRFEEFGTLWRDVAGFSRESLARRKFEDDPEFAATVHSDLTPREDDQLGTDPLVHFNAIVGGKKLPASADDTQTTPGEERLDYTYAGQN